MPCQPRERKGKARQSARSSTTTGDTATVKTQGAPRGAADGNSSADPVAFGRAVYPAGPGYCCFPPSGGRLPFRPGRTTRRPSPIQQWPHFRGLVLVLVCRARTFLESWRTLPVHQQWTCVHVCSSRSMIMQRPVNEDAALAASPTQERDRERNKVTREFPSL